jgi:hypothetical protein
MLKLLSQANFGGGFTPPVQNAYTTGSAESSLKALSNGEALLSAVIGFLTIVAGLLFIFHFVVGALNWVSAGGEQGKIQKARDKMTQGVVGLVVIVISYALIGIVGSVVGLDLLRPGKQIYERLNPNTGATP